MARKAHSIKFSDAEWEKAKERAEEEGLRVSTYIREIASGQLEVESEESRQALLAEFFVVGGKLKELMRKMDEGGYEHDSIAVGRLLDRTRKVIGRADGYTAAAPDEDDQSLESGGPLNGQEPPPTQ